MHEFEPLQFDSLPDERMLERAHEFHDLMSRRRTVRHFSDRPVPRQILAEAVRAAGTAPSGAHKQPWHFVLVGDRPTKERIREAAEQEEKESYERRMPQTWLDDLAPLGTTWEKPFLTICPWLIVVFAQPYGIDSQSGEKHKHYYVSESVGISSGLLIAALHHAGLATLTHTPSPMGFLQRILKRPENERAYLLVAVGHPEDGCRVPKLDRKKLGDILTEV